MKTEQTKELDILFLFGLNLQTENRFITILLFLRVTQIALQLSF